jgi:hypothetical protein
MGKLTDYIRELLNRQIKDYGIVVWYDPEEQYAKAVDNIRADAELFKFQGSFFELKHKLDHFLEEPKQPKLIIYVPKKRNDIDDALIEFDKAGCILEPGHSSINQNTRLEVLTRAVLKPIMPDNVENICKQVSSGSLSFQDIEEIAEQSQEIGTGTIKLIFGSADPVEVCIRFLIQSELDGEINAKNALLDLVKLLESSYGVALPADTEGAREKLRRYVLIGDFLQKLSQEEIPSALSSMGISKKNAHVQNTIKLATRWRGDYEYRDNYIEGSKKVERECSIEGLDITLQILRESQTFISTENHLLNHACELILNSNFDEAAEIIRKRKNSFWSRTEEILFLRWSILESVVNIGTMVSSIENELKGGHLAPAEFIHKYCDGDSAWYELDKLQRELEYRYDRYFIDLARESQVEKVIAKARQLYNNTVSDLASAFQKSCESCGFDFGDITKQREIFADMVKPILEDNKIAYIWVDALRYEMAAELAESFGADYDAKLGVRVATLPGITPVGMASLLPGAEKSFALEEKQDKLAVNINGKLLSNRQDRIKYLDEFAQVTDTKLDLLQKPSKNLREQISESNFVLVTSQEIDEICEKNNALIARRAMGLILEQIRRAIINLANLGIETFIVTADHGYVFLEEISESDKVDEPGGEKIGLHRRTWIGKGGKSSGSYLRFKEQDVGLSGDHEIVFPRRLGCFKVPGKENPYFHGGITLQEMVIPAIKITAKEPAVSVTEGEIEMALEKSKITNRLFSVRLLWKSPVQQQLLGDRITEKRVRLVLKSGRNEVGEAIQAVYGYEDGTKDIILEQDKPNLVTMMLTRDDLEQVNLSLQDAETLVELKKIEKIEVNLTI